MKQVIYPLELYENSNSISLYDAVPQVDSEAIENNDEYEFVLKNNGTLNSTFKIKLDNTCTIDKEYVLEGNKVKPDKCVPNEYIKVALKEGESKYEVLEYDEEKDEYIIDADKLEVNEERNYKIKIWLAIDTPNEYSSVNGETILYSGKLSVDYEQGEEDYLENYYIIRYNSNDEEGIVSDEKVSFSSEVVLKDNVFTKEGYTIKGYSLEKNGEVIYQPGDSVKELTNLSGGIVNLYTIWEKKKYTVYVVVQNGLLDSEPSGVVQYEDEILFNLESSYSTDAIVSCTNDQAGSFEDYELKVENVSSDTVCTVSFVPGSTVLYTDGTFIINEKGTDRESNITLHGEVVKEYEPFSETQSYVFSNPAAQLWLNEKDAIIDVEIGQEIKPTNTGYWFYQCINMKSGNFSKLNTANTINTAQMFADSGTNSSSYQLIGLEKWDVSNVDNMTYMFSQTGKNAEEWSITDISNWNVSKVKFMQYMFSFAGNKAQRFNLDLSAWDVSNVTNMNSLFSLAGSNASDWSIGDLSNWNVSNVTNMGTMFHTTGINDDSWTIGDISSWNVSNVTNMVYMFNSVGNAVQNFNLNLSGWDTSSVTNMSFMFLSIAKDSETFIIEGLDNWDVSNVTNMSYMFFNSGSNSKNWDIGDLTSWDVSSVTTTYFMFGSAGKNAVEWDIGSLASWNLKSVTNVAYMFSNTCNKCTDFELDLSNWNVSGVTDFSGMFGAVAKAAEVFDIGDLSSWDVSNALSLKGMFGSSGDNVSKFYIGDISFWDVSNVTDVSGMFNYTAYNSENFNIGDISSWNTSKVTTMSNMFNNAGAKTNYKLDLSGWKVPLVTSYDNFNVGVTDKITPPVWVN